MNHRVRKLFLRGSSATGVAVPVPVTLLLVLHAGLLAWSAAIHSPTVDEPSHLASGLHHWKTGDFRPYCVNPHLPRMIGALAVMIVAPDRVAQLDHSDLNQVAAGSRSTLR